MKNTDLRTEFTTETKTRLVVYNDYVEWLERKLVKLLTIPLVIQRSEQLIDFFKWLNDYEELKYTEKGIEFYVNEYLKSINCV